MIRRRTLNEIGNPSWTGEGIINELYSADASLKRAIRIARADKRYRDVADMLGKASDIIIDAFKITDGRLRNPQANLSESKTSSRTPADIVQDFIDEYGFQDYFVYPRTDEWLAIDFEGLEDNVYPLLSRLHSWGLEADIDDHYIEIYIGDDERFN